MSRRWFTSDLHLGDPWASKMRWCADDVDKHDAWQASLWDTAVAADDEVWVLGDVANGRSPEQVQEWLAGRVGVKHLVRGNWDTDLGVEQWREVGFDHVCDGTMIEVGEVRVWLSHYPTARLPDNGVNVVLHGHTHKRVRSEVVNGVLRVHVGHDAWRRLVAEEDVIVLLEQERSR